MDRSVGLHPESACVRNSTSGPGKYTQSLLLSQAAASFESTPEKHHLTQKQKESEREGREINQSLSGMCPKSATWSPMSSSEGRTIHTGDRTGVSPVGAGKEIEDAIYISE